MKSICGYWALDGQPAPDALPRMRTAGMHCTTPHLSQWQDDQLAFGSAWWSPQSSLQPPVRITRHPQTGCVIVADARLDNTAELRTALALPAPIDALDTTTDHAATLLLHAWLRWGEDCVDHIDGDFAFAIHDPRHRLLYLARDRMAGRPLYVHHVPGKRVVFGSTSHAVLAHPQVPSVINEARIADFLVEGLEGVDFTSTFHLAVERLPPRHVLRITPDSHQRRQYWKLEPGRAGPLPSGDDEWADALTEVLERAVARRLAGPERAGSMLSGGLDSTSLAIIAGEQLQAANKPPLPTFSAIHTGLPGCKETEAVHHLLGLPIFTPHLTDLANLGERLPKLERFLEEFDEPFDAGMTLVDAQFLAAAEAGVDAVIDGIDGDTLFSAGDVLLRQIRHGQWSGALQNARGLARIHGGQPWMYLFSPARAAFMPRWLRQTLWPLRNRRRKQQHLQQSLIAPGFASAVDVHERLQQLRSLRSLHPLPSPEAEAAEALSHSFPIVGLERYYRLASRHGVTPLHPFTDRQVLELGVNFPDRQHLRDGWSKPILRHAMRGRMPDPVRWRNDKQHLGWQLNHALWEAKDSYMEQLLRTQRPALASWVDMGKMDVLLTELHGPKHDAALAQLLEVASLSGWLTRRIGHVMNTPVTAVVDNDPKGH